MRIKTLFFALFFYIFLIGAPIVRPQHDVLFEAAALHGERTELIYLRSGSAASFSGISR